MKPEETIYNSNYGTNPMYQSDNFGQADGEATAAKSGTPRLVKIGAAGVTGLAIGAVGFMLTSSAMDDEETIDAIVVDDDDEELDDTEDGGEMIVNTRTDVTLTDGEISMATSVTDDMSFSEAFAAARSEVGPGGAFVWHGNVYGTYTAQEWNSMTPAEQQAFGSHFDWNHIDGSRQDQTPGDDNHDDGHDDGRGGDGHDNQPGDDRNGHNGGRDGQPGDDPSDDPTVNTGAAGEDPEIEIIGIVQDNTMGMGYVEMRVNGHETYMIDQDGDGSIDVIVSDLNDNGELDPGETEDVSAAGLTMQDVSDTTGIDITVIDYDTIEVPVEDPDEVVDDLTDMDIDLTDDQALDI